MLPSHSATTLVALCSNRLPLTPPPSLPVRRLLALAEAKTEINFGEELDVAKAWKDVWSAGQVCANEVGGAMLNCLSLSVCGGVMCLG